MLKFVYDYHKTKKVCKTEVKKFRFVIIHVHDRCKTQEMCNKVIIKIDQMLKDISDSYKNEKMCDKDVDYCYYHTLKLVPDVW